MPHFARILLFLLLSSPLSSQNLYFPPLTGDEWETLSPASLNWNEDKIPPLYDFLEGENTRAFIVLKDGKIVLEKYFGTFTQDSLWYWASAGKTVTALLTGIAQQEGSLSLDDLTSDYLGAGWTACPPEKEALITIRHQLTMTSGLDDDVPDYTCTLDTCLIYKADAGTRWAYHNGPYTLLDGVIESATGQSLNAFYIQKLRSKIGMNGAFLQLDYNNVLFSNPRSMARFGLLLLNGGEWNGTPVLADSNYPEEMTHSSQNINRSYGYLTWLNGQDSYMIPQTQLTFPGSLNPDAPADMYAAMGKNGQFLNVVPSQNLVLVRMGDAPDNSQVPFLLNNQIWQYFNEVIPETTPTKEVNSLKINVFPNPASERLRVDAPAGASVFLFDVFGKQVGGRLENGWLPLTELPEGVYFLQVKFGGEVQTRKVVVSASFF